MVFVDFKWLGKPFLSLEGEINDAVKKELKINDIHISLAH